MSKISEIISKQVISLYDAKIVGTIENIILNDNFSKIKSYIIYSDNTGEKKELNIKDIYSFSDDNFVIKNSEKLKDILILESFNNPINKEVVDTNGVNLGKINEIEINDNKIEFLSLNNGQKIEPKNIISTGEIIVVNLSENNIKKSHFAPKKNKIINLNEIKVKIQKKPIEIIPPRVSATSLVGKQAPKTVIGFNNELIVKKGQFITDRIIDRAKFHGKLAELFGSPSA